MQGEPALLIDLPGRELHFFGLSFLATDTVLLALAVLIGFLSIFFLTAVLGRVWCGWACPQTVYMEFVFRPLERLFMGTAGRGGRPRQVAPWRRAGMYGVYFVICLHLAQTFMAYFVGAEQVREWMWGNPADHPAAFTVVAALTIAMMIDFAWWREQLCIIGCPYGRLQSVLLDRNSTIVAYDGGRGEPRSPLRKSAGPDAERGACVDCSLCVQVCPTGIDIRDGLQLECLHCTQCADACDSIMRKTGQPEGLVRYTSEAALAGEAGRVVRPRVVAYGSLLSGLVATLLLLAAHTPHADVTVLRSLGNPFRRVEGALIENTMRLKINNRTEGERTYALAIEAPEGLRLSSTTRTRITVASDETLVEPVHLRVPASAFVAGRAVARLSLTDDEGWSTSLDCTLIGPSSLAPRPASPEHGGSIEPQVAPEGVSHESDE